MVHMSTFAFALVVLVSISITPMLTVFATPGSPPDPDYRWANPAAVEKWHDMKFGLRIHWGLYAIDGIGPESWPLNRAKGNQTFLNWYWSQAKMWKPAKYDATNWITMMQNSGVKFFDFTTKHHEGFSMYDTNTRVHDCWDFDLTPGAKTVKGIKSCVASAPTPSPTPVCHGVMCTYISYPSMRSTAIIVKELTNITVETAEAACSADVLCAGFNFFKVPSSCGVGCATMKADMSKQAGDVTNTAYVKVGFPGPPDPNNLPTLPPDGIAFSSVTSCGRDFTEELVTAARKGGIIPGLYFSNIDWFDADMRIDQWNAVAAAGKLCDGIPCDPALYNSSSNPEQWKRFVLRHRAQVMEVLTKYGEICEASFDMSFPSSFDKDITDTFMLARQLAPNTLFRGRGMGGKREDGGYGDYDTPEETFPDKPVPGNWQVIYHGSAFMSYDPNPKDYVNGSFIIWHLVDVVAKGGLMQIGYGPDKDGEFHPLAVKALLETGAWLKLNGEAIYSTRSVPVHWNDTESSFVRYTRSKDNTTLFAIALLGFGGPTVIEETLTLACVNVKPDSDIFLFGWEPKLEYKVDTTTGKTTIQIPKEAFPDLISPGYALKISGTTKNTC